MADCYYVDSPGESDELKTPFPNVRALIADIENLVATGDHIPHKVVINGQEVRKFSLSVTVEPSTQDRVATVTRYDVA